MKDYTQLKDDYSEVISQIKKDINRRVKYVLIPTDPELLWQLYDEDIEFYIVLPEIIRKTEFLMGFYHREVFDNEKPSHEVNKAIEAKSQTWNTDIREMISFSQQANIEYISLPGGKYLTDAIKQITEN